MVRTKPRKSDDVKRNVPKNSAGRASKNSRETQALGMSDDYEKNTRKDSRSKERDGISEEAHSLFQQVKPFQFYANFLHNLMEEQVDGRSPKRAGGKRGSSNSQRKQPKARRNTNQNVRNEENTPRRKRRVGKNVKVLREHSDEAIVPEILTAVKKVSELLQREGFPTPARLSLVLKGGGCQKTFWSMDYVFEDEIECDA